MTQLLMGKEVLTTDNAVSRKLAEWFLGPEFFWVSAQEFFKTSVLQVWNADWVFYFVVCSRDTLHFVRIMGRPAMSDGAWEAVEIFSVDNSVQLRDLGYTEAERTIEALGDLHPNDEKLDDWPQVEQWPHGDPGDIRSYTPGPGKPRHTGPADYVEGHEMGS